jgi:mannose-1-phosphate guanylyltransferase
VILAGGGGTRFWPESRRAHPKQFLNLSGERTLIQATLDRCGKFIPPIGQWIVTNRQYADETARQLPDVPLEQILLEPCGRNTAPCIGLVAMHLLAVDRDPIMLVLPADHVIATDEQFQSAVAAAEAIVQDEPQSLVLFGVKPTYPATGFGYIQCGEPMELHSEADSRKPAAQARGAGPSILASASGSPRVDDSQELPPLPRGGGEGTKPMPNAYHVKSFREKPDRNTAAQYLTDGDYLWNCGIFVWRARAILDALYAFEPEISARLKSLQQSLRKPEWDAKLAAEFPQMKSISIDYAVLERSPDACVLEAPFTWDDVGSWQALARWRPQDEQGNTADGPFCGVATEDCIIRTTPEHLVATFGVKDLVIVHTPTATLVADRNDENALRRLTEELGKKGFVDYL